MSRTHSSITATVIKATSCVILALALAFGAACDVGQTASAEPAPAQASPARPAEPAPAQPSPAAKTAGPELFLFLYRPGPSWRKGAPMKDQGLQPHGAYMKRLLDDGRLYAGGGFVDVDGGMAIMRAKDMDEARALLAADPAITAGIFQAEIRQWRPRFRADGFMTAK
jgi:uncharacterized protein YciI